LAIHNITILGKRPFTCGNEKDFMRSNLIYRFLGRKQLSQMVVSTCTKQDKFTTFLKVAKKCLDMAEKRTRTYSAKIRKQAAQILAEGVGHRALAGKLNIPEATARQWARTYSVGGEDALLNAGVRHRVYSFETKLAVVQDRAAGFTVREVMVKHNVPSESSVKAWCRQFRDGGADALVDKPRGRKPKQQN
jgi:transposase